MSEDKSFQGFQEHLAKKNIFLDQGQSEIACTILSALENNERAATVMRGRMTGKTFVLREIEDFLRTSPAGLKPRQRGKSL